MRDKTDHIHEPKAKELRTAEPDVLTLLLHAYERVTTPEDAMKGCHDAGAKYVELEQVKEHFADLKRLQERWIIPANEYLKKQKAAGGDR
jgi:hypothetical protein